MDLREKLFNLLIRVLATLLTGGGTLQLVSGKSVGKIILRQFERDSEIVFLNSDHITETRYSSWAGEMAFGGLNIGIGLAPFLLAFLLVVGHILAKKELEIARPSNERTRQLLVLYRKFYWVVTVAVGIGLLLLLPLAPSPASLVAFFVLLAVPAVLYLFSYSKDFVNGGFGERFVYLAWIVFFLAGAFSMPVCYGKKFFDLRLRPVLTIGDQVPPSCNETTLTFDINARQYSRVHFNPSNSNGPTRLSIELFEEHAPVTSDHTFLSLRELAETLRPAEDCAQNAEVILSDLLDTEGSPS